MVIRLYAVACIAFAFLLLGGSGIALAGDDTYGSPSDDSYSTPDSTEHPAAPYEDAVPPEKDSGEAAPYDGGGDDASAPPPPHAPAPY